MMDCFCDYEPPEFYNKYSLRARKVHRCEECGGEIRAGEKYEYVSGKWCGDFSTFKTCERCADLRQWVKNSGHTAACMTMRGIRCRTPPVAQEKKPPVFALVS